MTNCASENVIISKKNRVSGDNLTILNTNTYLVELSFEDIDKRLKKAQLKGLYIQNGG